MSTNIERAAEVIATIEMTDDPRSAQLAAQALAAEGLLVTDEQQAQKCPFVTSDEGTKYCTLGAPLTDEQARLIERGREAERQDDEVRAWTKKHGPVNIANISAPAEEQARLIADFRRIGSEIHARRNGRTEYALAGLIDELAVVLSRADAIYAERETP